MGNIIQFSNNFVFFAEPFVQEEGTGVIVVDVQGDFTTWKQGALAVEGADEAYVNSVEKATVRLANAGYRIFATQDWHPADHISFYTNHPGKKAFDTIEINGKAQILWPPHCVQGTEKAQLLIEDSLFKAIIKKGQDPNYDSYSGFKDDGGRKTGLDEILRHNGIANLIIYGLATDYCVKATAIDAAELGYNVAVIISLCRAVSPDTAKAAIEEMKGQGIGVVRDLEELKIF